MRTALLALALCACTTQGDDLATQDEPLDCARIEGSQLGQRVTLLVPSIDADNPVTFVGWMSKQDAPGQYIGFSLDTSVHFIVKADFNFFFDAGSTWQNPFGDSGTLAKAIEYVDVCAVSRAETLTIATP